MYFPDTLDVSLAFVPFARAMVLVGLIFEFKKIYLIFNITS
jgi:hypothetical protein